MEFHTMIMVTYQLIRLALELMSAILAIQHFMNNEF